MTTAEEPLVEDQDAVTLAEQQRIRLPLPIVKASRDYHDQVALRKRMDESLRVSGIEAAFVGHMLGDAAAEATGQGKVLTDRRGWTVQHFARRSIRCVIARVLSNES